MRVSLVARYVSHPIIDFGASRRLSHRSRLGLDRAGTVYHRPGRAAGSLPTVRILRAATSRFSFPPVGRLGRVPARRAATPFGPPRVRRA
ncbi:MAG: hypothetical protein ACRDGV_01410 [Candidatus Limnocylindria bacterium]